MYYGTVDREAQRLAVLEGYQVLDTECERAFDDLAAIAAKICQTPIALVVFVDKQRQWFKARYGMEKRETPRTVAFCHYTIQGKTPFIVHDALDDERFCNNPLVTSEPKIRFYAGIPLITKGGFAIGTLCVIDRKPRTLTKAQVEALEALSRQVLSQLELRQKLWSEERLKRELESRVLDRTRELVKKVQEARSASRMKSAFLANMSHEIRTPLGAILGFTELLKDPSVEEEEKRNYLDIITRNGELLETVINDILDLSKIEAGYLHTENLPITPRSLIEDVTALLTKAAEQRGLWLKTDFNPGLPEVFYSDPTRCKQILMNIIGNAIKFTQDGGVTVSAGYDATDHGSQKLVIEVRDTGIGIPREQQERLFKSFSQADESMTRKHGGTGLGLALSKRLAEILQGDVFLKESLPDQGSTFVITIKDQRYSTAALEHDGPDTDHEEHPPDRNALRSVKVLVVDDSPDNQQLISRLLQKYGATVDTAGNGKDGIVMAETDHYDVVLMDLQMPILDGYSAVQRLRAHGFTKPIIALTAHAQPEDRRRCSELGCTDHLPKPIEIEELVRSIVRSLPERFYLH